MRSHLSVNEDSELTLGNESPSYLFNTAFLWGKTTIFYLVFYHQQYFITFPQPHSEFSRDYLHMYFSYPVLTCLPAVPATFLCVADYTEVF